MSSDFRKKERRETWAASRTRNTMSRKSLYAFAMHPLPLWREEKPAAAIPRITEEENEEEVNIVWREGKH